MSESPTAAHIPLACQVGGHLGILTTEDGSLLIKPALAAEVIFYQYVETDQGLAPLRPFLPRCYGTLRLEGQVDPTADALGSEGTTLRPVEGITDAEKDSIVLENITHPFKYPNILDIKLGTVLYDDQATPEKRKRMEIRARETTSLETGIRLTGFQVYDLSTATAVNTPKSYGVALKPADLPDGIARFFPIAKPLPVPIPQQDASVEVTGTGLPTDILLPLLIALREDIAAIRAALAQVHMRMVGGSLLVVYEADWERAREGLQRLAERAVSDELSDEDEGDEDVGIDESDEEEDEEGVPYVVKLIDFAHTKIVPGEGPDDGVLLGIDTILKLLDGRIEGVKGQS